MTVDIRTVPLTTVTGVLKVRKSETFVYTCGCFGIADRKRGVNTVGSLHCWRDANAVLSRRKERSMLRGLFG
jgi:hypothetical protein